MGVKTLSGGQQRRLALALGIVGDPDLIFLDEPTTGFDPSARRQAWELVGNLRELGKTIILTTHYMDEAQNLADRIAVIAQGRIVATGSADTLGGRDLQKTVVRFRLPDGVEAAELSAATGSPAAVRDRWVEFRSDSPTALLQALTEWAAGRELEGLTVLRPSLEDVYLELTGTVGDHDA
jgi:ABC-2 type transport system ATP-binding protein